MKVEGQGGGEALPSNVMTSAGGEIDLVEDYITFIILASLKASFAILI